LSVPASVQIGDFGVSHMGGQAGKLIRFGQWLNGSGFSDYEHAFIYVGNGKVIEAEPAGARLATFNYGGVLWSSDKVKIDSPLRRLAIVTLAHSYAGTPYSWADYFALATHRLHIPAPGLKSYVSTSGHMICSQLVDRCYQDAGIQLFDDGRWNGYVTPGDLAQLLGAR
jgi:cell wall-associated NlpC family hydrolase